MDLLGSWGVVLSSLFDLIRSSEYEDPDNQTGHPGQMQPPRTGRV